MSSRCRPRRRRPLRSRRTNAPSRDRVTSPRLDDPAFWAGDPEPALAALRAESPVHWYEPGGFWALTRHADIHAVSRAPEDFCSSRGVLMQDRQRMVAASDSIL